MVFSSGLKRIFANTSWIVLERAIRLGVGFFVGVWVALFATFRKLWLEGIVVGARDVVSERYAESAIPGTATAMRIIGGLVVVLASITLNGVPLWL